jgi:hypothetical protein
LFATNLEQVPPDVTGYFADRSATLLSKDPPLDEIAVCGGALTLIAAELGTVATNQLVADKAVCRLAHPHDARLHTKLQPVCPLVAVALFAIFPGHSPLPGFSHSTPVLGAFSRLVGDPLPQSQRRLASLISSRWPSGSRKKPRTSQGDSTGGVRNSAPRALSVA